MISDALELEIRKPLRAIQLYDYSAPGDKFLQKDRPE
jgi:hypothetical protein